MDGISTDRYVQQRQEVLSLMDPDVRTIYLQGDIIF